MADEDWRSRRRDAAAAQADALAQRQAAEHAAARRLLADFVTEARRIGVEPVPLRARSYDGRHRYRTPLEGWYLRSNESVAVSTAGDFYVLSVPAGVRALLRGVEPEPADPPLVLGRGGRDGESVDLADALRAALER
ncbi:hypothetical protein [Actinotalea sp. Marseille-Q4924]|uniref:hypothetical protein n=1 Tax=Actinotalea sp. Marseille-Q4924 TaxID=2866571 RepID=UPI001CE403F1|nr:hypothetical protein [Actinotalea sp. Marseille-Q4924]